MGVVLVIYIYYYFKLLYIGVVLGLYIYYFKLLYIGVVLGLSVTPYIYSILISN